MTSEKQKPAVIVICGPTGVGKTSAAIQIAESFNGEIISADSMQIYRHMNIGTAKPTPYEQALITHHMVDIVEPYEPFNAARFTEMAGRLVSELYERGVTPFLVGGTGLYIKALLSGLFQFNGFSPDVRIRLKEEANLRGTIFLHKNLSICDPVSAKKIHPNDAYRIIRALEVYNITGKPLSEYHNSHNFSDQPFRVLKIGLYLDREVLYDRINDRVDAMIEKGFVGEVKQLLGMGYSPDLKPMRAFGYRHLIDFFNGNLEWDEVLRTFKRDTRRYAKRQMTWFRADSDIKWMKPGDLKNMIRLIENFL